MGAEIDTLLLKAAALGASDLHISAEGKAVVRINGALIRLCEMQTDIRSLLEPILTEKQRVALRENGECDFAYGRGKSGNLRVTLPWRPRRRIHSTSQTRRKTFHSNSSIL